MNIKIFLSRLPAYLILTITAIVTVYPFLFMLSTSLKDTLSIYSTATKLIPDKPTLDNYSYILKELPFLRWLLNTFIVAGSVTLIKLFTDSMAGYAFARRNFVGKDIIFTIIISTLMIPIAVTIIPTFLLVKKLGLYDNYLGLILPPLALPIGIFLMRQYLTTIPADLEDAARIDGCTEFQIYLQVILPLAKPALAVLAIFTFMNQWVALLWPVIVTNSEAMRTLTVGISVLKAQWVSNWGVIMAASFGSFFPVMVVFLFFQQYFVKGLTVGAIKG
jgi:multiple sugar transport system permease protein